MNKIKYLVTNGGEGSICIAGRQRLEIPGKCVDLEIALPDITAKTTISRLKQRYPLLSFKEAEVDAPEADKKEEGQGGAPEADTAPSVAKTTKKKSAQEPAPTEPVKDASEVGNGN